MIIQPEGMELLVELVRANRDVEAAFLVCAEQLDSEPLCSRLLKQARTCGRAAMELTELVRVHGGAVRDDGTWRTDSAPDWVALRTALVDGNNSNVLEECLRAEDQLLVRFRDVFDHDLPGAIRGAVQDHFAALIQDCGRLRELRLPALLREQPTPHYHRAQGKRSVKMSHSV